MGVDPRQPSLAQQALALRSDGPRLVESFFTRDAVVWGPARNNWLYDGFIATCPSPVAPQRYALVVGGVSEAATAMAVHRCKHLALLGDYSTGVFSSILPELWNWPYRPSA